MAVEKKRVIDRIKAKWPNLNLSQTRLDALADKLANVPADGADDTAIDALLDAQNTIFSFEEIARMDDKTRTLEAENKKLKEPKTPPANPTPPQETATPPEPPADPNQPDWVKTVLESNKKIAERLEAIEKGKTIESKTAQVKDLFSKSDVLKGLTPSMQEKLMRLVDLDSETPFAEQITALETEYKEIAQLNANQNNFPGPAGGGGQTNEADEKMVEAIVGKQIPKE